MRAILIDPIAHTITEVEHNGDFRHIYTLLSDPPNGLEVDDFNIVDIGNDNTLYVDGEGLLKNPRYFFTFQGYHQPLAGRGLVLACDEEGETIPTTLTIAEIKAKVTFGELSVQGFKQDEGVADHPILGPNTHFIRSTPIFGPPEPSEEENRRAADKIDGYDRDDLGESPDY